MLTSPPIQRGLSVCGVKLQKYFNYRLIYEKKEEKKLCLGTQQNKKEEI